MDVNTLRSQLTKYGQEHLLQFWDQLDTDQQKELYDQLSELDLDEAKVELDLDKTIQWMTNYIDERAAHDLTAVYLPQPGRDNAKSNNIWMSFKSKLWSPTSVVVGV